MNATEDIPKVKVLHLLSSGGIGGIEVLCNDIGKYSKDNNTFCFLYNEGVIFDGMRNNGLQVVSFTRKNFLLSFALLYRYLKAMMLLLRTMAHWGFISFLTCL